MHATLRERKRKREREKERERKRVRARDAISDMTGRVSWDFA